MRDDTKDAVARAPNTADARSGLYTTCTGHGPAGRGCSARIPRTPHLVDEEGIVEGDEEH